ncbi:hypothetical protein V8E36_005447 [Tilletia maclaganii]
MSRRAAASPTRASLLLVALLAALALTTSLVTADPRLHNPQRPKLSAEEALERKRDAFLFGTAYVDNAEHLPIAPLISHRQPPISTSSKANVKKPSAQEAPPKQAKAKKTKDTVVDTAETVAETVAENTASTARKVGSGIAHSSQNAASVLGYIFQLVPATLRLLYACVAWVVSGIVALLLWPIIHIVWPPLAIILDPVFMTLSYLYGFWVATPLHYLFRLVRTLYPMYLFLGAAVLTGLGLGFFATGGVLLGNLVIPVKDSSSSSTAGSKPSSDAEGPPKGQRKRRKSILDKAIAQKEREPQKQQQQQQAQQQQPQQQQSYLHSGPSSPQATRDFALPPTSPYQSRSSLREDPRSLSPIAHGRRTHASSASVAASGVASSGSGGLRSSHHHHPSSSSASASGSYYNNSHQYGQASQSSYGHSHGALNGHGHGYAPGHGYGGHSMYSPIVSSVAHSHPLPPSAGSSSSSATGLSIHHRKRGQQQQAQHFARSGVPSTA